MEVYQISKTAQKLILQRIPMFWGFNILQSETRMVKIGLIWVFIHFSHPQESLKKTSICVTDTCSLAQKSLM